jgi:16S rRNA (guanine527-N7)-methyltransferase
MNILPAELYDLHRKEFDRYLELLLKWNQKINLTAITKPDEIRELHFIDSLFVVPQIVSRETILDIGSGNGLPGLAIKIACPEIQVTLVESVKKKCDFMREIVRTLKLDRVTVLHQTLKEGDSIALFDAVISRAAFKMNRLIRLASPNLKADGIVIGMKGGNIEEELKDLKMVQTVAYALPFSGRKRNLLIVSRETI